MSPEKCSSDPRVLQLKARIQKLTVSSKSRKPRIWKQLKNRKLTPEQSQASSQWAANESTTKPYEGWSKELIELHLSFCHAATSLYNRGFNYKEIARRLDIPKKEVIERIARGR